LIKGSDNSHKIIREIRTTETRLGDNLNEHEFVENRKMLESCWKMGSSSDFWKIFKKWRIERLYIVRMIKWKFKILKKQLTIERKQFIRFTKMVETRMQHVHDNFEDFLVEASSVLDRNAKASVEYANKKFGIGGALRHSLPVHGT
jgi:hypothetical protein